MKRWIMGFALFMNSAVLGAASVEEVEVPETVFVEKEPPAEIVEEVTNSPGEKFVWIKGHWRWSNGWVWTKGHWHERPHHDAVWVSGYWHHRHHHWVWVPGHWE